VRLVEVFGVDMMGGLGTPLLAVARVEFTTGAGMATLGWIEAANSAINTVAILVRFTQAAKSKAMSTLNSVIPPTL